MVCTEYFPLITTYVRDSKMSPLSRKKVVVFLVTVFAKQRTLIFAFKQKNTHLFLYYMTKKKAKVHAEPRNLTAHHGLIQQPASPSPLGLHVVGLLQADSDSHPRPGRLRLASRSIPTHENAAFILQAQELRAPPLPSTGIHRPSIRSLRSARKEIKSRRKL